MGKRVIFENFFALSFRLEPWDHLQSLRKYFYRNQRPQIDLQLTGFDPKLVSSGYILHFAKKKFQNLRIFGSTACEKAKIPPLLFGVTFL